MSAPNRVFAPSFHDILVERDQALAELNRARAGVTVVIPCFEQQHLLYGAVNSTINQTIPPAEIIVVDDGSSTSIVCDLQTKDETTLRVVRITNRGLPAARNTGLMLAKTEAIVFLDADDRLRPEFIERTMPLFKTGADVVLVGLQEVGPQRNGAYMPGYNRHWDTVTVDHLWAMNLFFYCAMLRVSTMREIGGYNPLMAGPWNQSGGYEDHDVWIDLMTRGAKFAAVNEVLFDYSTANTDSMVHRAERNRAALTAEMHRHHRRGT